MKQKYIQLRTGYPVSSSLYDSVLEKVQSALPKLVPGKPYKLKHIYGITVWGRLDIDDRLNAGRCMVDIAAKKLLPLEHIGRGGDNAALYQLK